MERSQILKIKSYNKDHKETVNNMQSSFYLFIVVTLKLKERKRKKRYDKNGK